jgi:GDSL-like lipase/acylhydrolase family protein
MNPFLSTRHIMRHKDAIASITAFLISLIVPTFAAGSAASTPESPSLPSKAMHLARQLALGAVDTLFLFDHLFTQPSTVVSANYLSRVADPQSRFHTMYLNYKQGRTSQAELVACLPHVALIGDSLSRNMSISSVPSMFWRSRTDFRRNWFLDSDPSSGSIYSLEERIEKLSPLVATQYAANGAVVSAHSGDEDLVHTLGRGHNFAGQVDQALKAKRFPDLLLIWIGHNNLCWTWNLTAQQRQHPDAALRMRTEDFKTNYVRQLRRLLDRAKKEDHYVAVVVFGLINCEAYFKARHTAEALRANNHKLFPYLETGYRSCEAMKPEYRQNITRLELMMNRELKSAVSDLRDELQLYPRVRLQYSDALAKLDITNVAVYSIHDAWHFSPKGHDLVAQATFTALTPSLHFLGIESQGNTMDARSRSPMTARSPR